MLLSRYERTTTTRGLMVPAGQTQFAFLFPVSPHLHLRIQISWRFEERFRCNSRERIPAWLKIQLGKLRDRMRSRLPLFIFRYHPFSSLQNIAFGFFLLDALKQLQNQRPYHSEMDFVVLLWRKLFFQRQNIGNVRYSVIITWLKR